MTRATCDILALATSAAVASVLAIAGLDFNPDQPRDDHGRFGEGGGGASDHGHASTSRAMKLIAAPVHLEHAIKDAVVKGAKSAIGYVKELATGNLAPTSPAAIAAAAASAVGKHAGVATTIAHGVKLVAKGGAKLYFASWLAGQHMVERVALAKGLTPEAAAKVRSICSGYDVLASKAVFLGLEHTGMPHLAAASLFVPTASAAYLACSVATNPVAVAKAAGGAVKDVWDKARSVGGKIVSKIRGTAAGTGDVASAVGILADAIKRHSGADADWFFALLPHAMELSSNISEAVALAEQTLKLHPTP